MIFKHEKSICETDEIGSGTRIWAFTHILSDVVIGKNCNICDHVFIESGVRIGDNVTIKSGVQLWAGTTIEDDVFIGPNVTFTNDKYPKSRNSNFDLLKTIIRKNSSIGANSTILPGLEIGPGSIVGAGAVLTKNLPPDSLAVGNPAKITKISS
jgi:acetyltransferase-like isoleucine patch superfamily enzyme